MTTELTTETEANLCKFSAGSMPAEELEAWIISAVEDEADEALAALWEQRLLLTEAGEGIRPLADAKQRARSLLRDAA